MKFELDDAERKQLDEWNKKHLKTEHEGKEPYIGAIGGRLTFQITGTSLGEVLSVYCGSCKAIGKPKELYTVDLTDYASW